MTPEQGELLAVLAEECAEVVQIVCKIQRHGLNGAHPSVPHISNAELLQQELGDVSAAVVLLERVKVVDRQAIRTCASSKLRRIQPYLHHYEVSAQDDAAISEQNELHRAQAQLAEERIARKDAEEALERERARYRERELRLAAPARSGDRPAAWVLFTPDFDYAKEPYWARSAETTAPVLCYPNGGSMMAMDGSGRIFEACECEIKFAGWAEDPHHPAYKRRQQVRYLADRDPEEDI